MLQVAALLLLASGRCTSKFVGEGGSGDVRPLSHAALLQLLLWLSSTTNTTGSALLVLQVAQYWTVGNSNTSSYLLIAPGYVYTVPTFGWSRIIFCGWWTLLSSAMREYECQWFPSSLCTLVTLLISSSSLVVEVLSRTPRVPKPSWLGTYFLSMVYTCDLKNI